MAYVWNKWCVYLCDGDAKGYIMVRLGNSVKWTRTPAVILNCHHHFATVVLMLRSSEKSYLKDYLVIFCMYAVHFIPTLDGAILPALIIDPRSFFSVYGEKYSMGFYSRTRYKFMCYVLHMLWLVCVCSHIFIPS